MSTAVDVFLRQIAFTGSIPFAVALPSAPDSINADKMNTMDIRQVINEGSEDIENGRCQPARKAFAEHKAGRKQ